MQTLRRSVSRSFIPAFALGLVLFSGCGDDTPDTDAGTDGGPVDTGRPDTGTPDTGVDAGPIDTGTPDTGVDAGTAKEYCVANDVIDRPEADVTLSGPTTGETNSASTGNRAQLSCLDEGPAAPLGANVRFEGCFDFFGTAPTLNELTNSLEGEVFLQVDANSMPVDPTFDPMTGLDRGTPLEVSVTVSDQAPQCDSGLALVLGADNTGLFTDVGYTLRIRSSTVGGDWVTTYYQGIIFSADQISGGGGGNCNPAACVVPFNLPVVRRTELQAMITAIGGNVPGSGDLDDQVGSGYAFLAGIDCSSSPLAGAVAGFDVAPIGAGYVTADGTLDPSLDAMAIGVYAGIGFTTTSSLGDDYYGGIGVQRSDNSCTEGFGFRGFNVYPDALSLVRFGRFTTFNRP